jgi:hypothetical protein
VAHSTSWRWNEVQPTKLEPVYKGRGVWLPLNITAPMQWSGLRRILNGRHAGCVEARDIRPFPPLAGIGVCEFAGRPSLAQLGGRFLLYARANRAAQGGQRSVQVSSSLDLVHWSPFEPIVVRGHDVLSATEGDIYFWLVQTNPVLARTLIALFPLVHHHRGCIGLSLSVDGTTWSRVTPLLRCEVHGARAETQPVGFALLPRGELAVFVHERVPGIAYDEKTPHRLSMSLQRLMSRRGGASIVRYTLPCEKFARWTAEGLAELGMPVNPYLYLCSRARETTGIASRQAACNKSRRL